MPRQVKCWLFTSFNLVENGRDEYKELFAAENGVRYGIWQLELCPETNRRHIQGYIEFNRSVRMGTVKRHLNDSTVHLEPRLGSREQAVEYCSKDESRISGPWSTGDMPELRPGKRNDLNRVADMVSKGDSILQVVEECPGVFIRYHRGIENLYNRISRKGLPSWREVETVVYYGRTGAGKTRRAVEESKEDYFILDHGDRIWWNGYDRQGTLIIDDFYGWIRVHRLLRLLDGYVLRLDVKGSFAYARWTKVIITSNRHPDEWYHNLRPEVKAAVDRRINQVIAFE